MIRYARETVATVIDEIQPLLRAHWEEIAQYPDIPLTPDYDQYKRAEVEGLLRIYTARADGELVGYAIYLVMKAMHYQTSLQARQDILYLSPSHRSGRVGWQLIKFADERLTLDGVQVVYQHMKAAHSFGPLLERMGYELSEFVYSRRLG